MLILGRISIEAVLLKWRETISRERRYEIKTRKYFEQNRVAVFVGITLILVLVIVLAIIISFAE